MPDVDERLRLLDSLEPPDLWADIRTREPRHHHEPRPVSRWMPIAVAAALAALGIGLLVRAFLGGDPTVQPIEPGPSPSGQTGIPAVANGDIWFQRGGGEGGTWIEAVDADGSNRRVLFSDPAAGGADNVGAAYDWSSDGSQVAFIDSTGYIGEVPTGSSYDVFVMNADGTGRRQLTDDGGFDAAPSWSADGARIVYASDRSDPNRPACEMDFSCNVDIYVVNVNGNGQMQLTTEPARDWQPDWSSDGRIAFVSDRDFPGEPFAGEVYVMNGDGTGVTRITTTTEGASQPRWSPDGTRIAFILKEGNSFSLYVMDADGANTQRLAGNLTVGHSVEPDLFDDFAWSPDGTMIAFVGGGDTPNTLFVVGADGSGLRKLVEDEAGLSDPFWRPGSDAGPRDVTTPAPRDCPTGIVRDRLVTPAQAIQLMRGHVPTDFPPGFGIQLALESSSGAGITWTDGRCRMVRVSFMPSGDPMVSSKGVDQVGPWVVEYDKAEACGNYIMGMGRCIGYTAAVGDGVVGVQTIGLSRGEADALVRSIPL